MLDEDDLLAIYVLIVRWRKLIAMIRKCEADDRADPRDAEGLWRSLKLIERELQEFGVDVRTTRYKIGR